MQIACQLQTSFISILIYFCNNLKKKLFQFNKGEITNFETNSPTVKSQWLTNRVGILNYECRMIIGNQSADGTIRTGFGGGCPYQRGGRFEVRRGSPAREPVGTSRFDCLVSPSIWFDRNVVSNWLSARPHPTSHCTLKKKTTTKQSISGI